MNSQQELKLLEEIENTPLPPDIIPAVFIDDEKQEVKLPKVVLDYFTKMNDVSKIDEEGKMHVKDYQYLLNKYGLNNNWISIITFYK